MIRILFVCLGNICRSPMAEAVLRDKIEKKGLENQIEVDSAGTGDWHVGCAPHDGTQQILIRNGISFQGIHARQVVPEDFQRFDWLIAMDRRNEADLLKMAANKDQRKEIIRFMDFIPENLQKDVPDPYFDGNFDRVYRLIDEGTGSLLNHLLLEKLDKPGSREEG